MIQIKTLKSKDPHQSYTLTINTVKIHTTSFENPKIKEEKVNYPQLTRFDKLKKGDTF